jgi:hypothetical protein
MTGIYARKMDGEGKARIGFWCERKDKGKGGRDGGRWRIESEVVG